MLGPSSGPYRLLPAGIGTPGPAPALPSVPVGAGSPSLPLHTGLPVPAAADPLGTGPAGRGGLPAFPSRWHRALVFAGTRPRSPVTQLQRVSRRAAAEGLVWLLVLGVFFWLFLLSRSLKKWRSL